MTNENINKCSKKIVEELFELDLLKDYPQFDKDFLTLQLETLIKANIILNNE